MTDLGRCALIIALTELEDLMVGRRSVAHRLLVTNANIYEARKALESAQRTSPIYVKALLDALHYWQGYYRKIRG